MEKLSSGMRINRAGDDAAGLAISEKMRGQIRGLNQASNNAQDAISMIQTAEGNLGETHSILQRMRELAVQSSTDTNVDTLDRESINNEFKQLKAEVDRIGNNTEFNTQKMLKGGEEATGKVTVTHTKAGKEEATTPAVAGKATGQAAAALDADVTGLTGGSLVVTVNSEAFTLSNTDIIALKDKSEADVATAIADKAVDGSSNKLSTVANVSFVDGKLTVEALDPGTGKDVTMSVTAGTAGTGNKTAEDLLKVGTAVTVAGADAVTTPAVKGESTIAITTNFAAGDKIEINGKTYTSVAADATAGDGEFKVGAAASDTADNLLAAIKKADTSVDASSSATSGTITLVQKEVKVVAEAFKGEMKSDFNATFQIGANQLQTMDISIGDMRAEALGIDQVSLGTGADAREAITTINDAINKVSTERSSLGGYQNRLEHTIKNLDNSSENLQAAESRIRDVDMAKEMMEQTKQNILSQAATAMLANANQAPQAVLQLLR